MKKTFIIALLFLCGFFSLKAQVTFYEEITITPYQPIQNCIATMDSGFALITNFGNVLKLDRFGDTLWTKRYDINPSYPQWTNILQTQDSGFLIWEGTNNVQYGQTFIRTNSLGDTLWTRHYPIGFNSLADFQPVCETSDGSFIFTFKVGGGYYTCLAKMNNLGNPLWLKSYDFVTSSNGIAVLETTDKCYLITSELNNYDFSLIKTDTSGNLLWNKNYHSAIANLSAFSSIQNNHGGFTISGVILIPGYPMGKGFLIEIDSIGNVSWAKYYSGNIGFGMTSVKMTIDGGYIVSGWLRDSSLANYSSALLFKTNAFGTVEWSKIIDDSTLSATKLNLVADEGYIMTINKSNDVRHITKTDLSGNNNCNTVPFPITTDTFTLSNYIATPTIPTSSLSYLNHPVAFSQPNVSISKCLYDRVENNAHTSITLYPNPAADKFKITSDQPIISINLFNLFGQSIYFESTFFNQSCSVDCRPFKTGIYFLQMQMADETIVKKVVINR